QGRVSCNHGVRAKFGSYTVSPVYQPIIHNVACLCFFLHNIPWKCFLVEVTMSAKSLMPAERQKEILERIRRDGRVLATDLAQEFQTSEDTIRRALRDLAAQGR